MTATKYPLFETDAFAFYILRVGASIVRKSDNASVYFQPGDATANAETNAEWCFKGEEMFPGEHDQVFYDWCAQYFD